MEDLSDEQLEIIFEMCDIDNKGFVTTEDLTNLTSDPDSGNQILKALRLGPKDALNFKQFVARVRGLDQSVGETKEESCRSPDRTSTNSEVSKEPTRTSATLVRAISASDVFATETIVFASPEKSSKIARLSSSRAAFSSTINRRDSDVLSRHVVSDIFTQYRRRDDSDAFSQSRRRSEVFSASTFAGSDVAVNDILSASINDLSGRIIEMQETHLESQFELRSILSQLSLKLQQDNDRKFEQLVAVVEDRFAARKSDLDEDKHLRCQLEKLESEKRSLLTDVSNLRDRVLELTHSIQIRDEELSRERRINDELESRVSTGQQEVNRLMEERQKLKSVNRVLLAKVDALAREVNETKSLREALNLENMRLEKEKANLAYEAAALASQRQKMVESVNQQYRDVVNPFRPDLSIEEDPIEFEPTVEIALQRFSTNREEEVMSQVLHDYHVMPRTSLNDADDAKAEEKKSILTKR